MSLLFGSSHAEYPYYVELTYRLSGVAFLAWLWCFTCRTSLAQVAVVQGGEAARAGEVINEDMARHSPFLGRIVPFMRQMPRSR